MKLNPCLLSFSVVASMYSTVAIADTMPTTTLQTITIVAQNTTNKHQKDDISHTDSIPAKQADTLGDYLPQIAGVNVGGSSTIDQNISIRGIGSDNDGSMLKITVDGVRQPETVGFHHMGTLGLDPDLFKATEVSVGNNSVTLGNNAMGGAVAFRTVDAEDLLRPDEKVGARVKLGYASNDKQFHSTATAYGKPTENSDVLVSYGQRKSDGGEDGDGRHIQGDDITIKNILAKASFTPVDGHKISLSYQDYDNEGNYPFQPNRGYQINKQLGNIFPGYMKNKTYSLGYEYTPNDDFTLTSKLYKQEHSAKVQGRRGGRGPIMATGGEGETVGFNWNVNQNFSSKLQNQTLNHNFTYGFEGYEKTTTNLTGNAKNEAKSLGLYVQDRVNLGKLTLTPGLRYDKYRISHNNGQTETFDKVSGALAGEYRILPKTTVFASYTQLFNGPRLPETIRTATYLYDISKIKPEKGANTEIGFNTYFNNVIAQNDRIGLTAKYFNTDYQDKITYVNSADETGYTNGFGYNTNGELVNGGTYTHKYTNVGDVKYKGYEIMANYNLNKLGLNLGYAHAKSKDEQGNRLGRDSGDQLTVGLNYGDMDSFLAGLNIRRIASLNRNGTDLKGFTTVDLTGSYKPTNLKNVSIDAGIYNLTDKLYTEHTANSTDDTAMGRNVKLAVTYQF